QGAAGELGARLGREAGVLAPHVTTAGAPVAAHRDQQRGGAPAQRLVRQLASDGVARGALAPAPSAPAVIGHDAAGQHRPIGLQPLAHALQAEVIEASERGQVRGSEGSVRHVEVFPVGSVRTPIIGRPRPLSHERRADAHARLYTATPTPWIRKSPFTRHALAHWRWDDGVLDTDTAKLIKAMLARFDLVAYAAAPDKVAFLRAAAGFESITDVDIRKSMADALGWVQDL